MSIRFASFRAASFLLSPLNSNSDSLLARDSAHNNLPHASTLSSPKPIDRTKPLSSARDHCLQSRLTARQQIFLGFCILTLVLAFLMSIASDPVYARSRRDRRPDREIRIRYPRSRTLSSRDGNNRPALRPASSSTTTASTSDSEPSEGAASTNE